MKKYAIHLIHRYQVEISPELKARGVRCIFETSCSHYAVEVLERHNFLTAIVLIVYRLLSCNPINAKLKSKNFLLIKK